MPDRTATVIEAENNLEKIIKLNIPIISEYITDIVDIVEKTKSIR